MSTRRIRTTSFTLLAATPLVLLAACSSSPDPSPTTSSPTPTPTFTTPTAVPTTTKPTATTKPVGAQCTSSALLAPLPSGAKMITYNCAYAGNEYWAGVKVNPGPTVYFEKAVNNKWTVLTKDSVCGTASAGLPPVILNYCK